MSKKALNKALRPDAQGFDEIRIFTVPRFKESELSGDEWRISATIQLWRKGTLVHEDGFRNVETAAQFLPLVLARAHDDGKGFYAGIEGICDQEGCCLPATVTYRVKKRYSRDNPTKWNEDIPADRAEFRQFCERHRERGDAAFDDSDSNYEIQS